MIAEIIDLLKKQKIEYIGVLAFSECNVINRRLLPFAPKSVVIFLAPYFTHAYENQNISHYAVMRDYHLFFNEIFCKIESEFPGQNLRGFSDHSPIGEIDAAAKAGLGIIGENGLLINETYGSYVFIGELFSDMAAPESAQHDIHHCPGCGACHKNCPSPDVCLSAMTQKKGVLTEDEQLLIKRGSSAWGCDICQNVCPYNRGVRETPISFFAEDHIPYLDIKTLCDMNDSEFKQRAYSWRKRDTIMRNIKILNREHN